MLTSPQFHALSSQGNEKILVYKWHLCCKTIHQFSQSVFTITEKAPTRAFSWLKAPTSAFTFKTLLRHYAKWALTPR